MRDASNAGLWLVTVTETKERVFWVLAESKDAAQSDATELAGRITSDEWDESDRDVDVVDGARIRRQVAAGDEIWTGGEDGHFEVVD